jgi:monoamine oxidase
MAGALTTQDRSVIVIGAGIAGLAAAWKLGNEGCRVAVLEARDRMGGRIWTLSIPQPGFPIELGAEFIHGRPPEVFDPLQKSGAEVTEVEGRSWCAFENQLRPCDFWSNIDSILSRMDASRADESFLDFLRRISSDNENNRDAQQRALGYIVGFNAADPALVGVHWLVHGMRAEEKIDGDRTFRAMNGYLDLLNLFQKRISSCENVDVRTGKVVERVKWEHGKTEVAVRGAAKLETVSASRVLITLPLSLLKTPPGQAGVVRFEPSLPAAKISALNKLEMGKVIRIVLWFRERFWDELTPTASSTTLSDMSFLLSDDEWFPTWWTSMPKRLPIITGWAPFLCAEKLSAQSQEFVIERSLRTLGRLLNVDCRMLRGGLKGAFFHDWQNDPFSRGAYSYGKVGSDGAQEELASPVAETLFFAGEATDMTGNNGTVHGAIASGYRAASQILETLN